jgi:uncharacterized protein (DUF1330 family)
LHSKVQKTLKMKKKTYLHPTQEAGRKYFSKPSKGSVVMLNLLKFREFADYSKSPELAPANKISGKEAYQLYIQHTLPFLKAAGSEVIYQGKSAHFLIGPEEETWDVVLLVKHTSAAKFMKFASDEGYLAGAGHRTAALEDSRLLPIEKGF